MLDAPAPAIAAAAPHLADLNPGQRVAAEFGSGGPSGPLLIIAGAGTGKTKTLAHRVAHFILNGADPQRILLLTFTRRAAAEMTRRAQRILGETRAAVSKSARCPADELGWAGTFHSIANRLLRLHADAIGLNPTFTVLDRSDSADLMNLIRSELGFAKKAARFPKKDTCLAIYSHTVNALGPLDDTLATTFPWCADWADELKELFRGYVAAKQRDNVLDYDDLLLYWSHMVADPVLAAEVGSKFDYVLVDEYQDTNTLQAAILLGIKPDGCGLTVMTRSRFSRSARRPCAISWIFPSAFRRRLLSWHSRRTTGQRSPSSMPAMR